MHEFSIANSLIEQVLSLAEENHAAGVKEVELETGAIRQIVPEMMHTAWQSVTIDTIASGSVLKITEVNAVAKCRLCSLEFTPEKDNYLCPKCVRADVDIIQGDSIILKSIEFETFDDLENKSES